VMRRLRSATSGPVPGNIGRRSPMGATTISEAGRPRFESS
jgi:hypothetical protein